MVAYFRVGPLKTIQEDKGIVRIPSNFFNGKKNTTAQCVTEIQFDSDVGSMKIKLNSKCCSAYSHVTLNFLPLIGYNLLLEYYRSEYKTT